MDDKHQISKLVRLDKFQFSKFNDQNNFKAVLNLWSLRFGIYLLFVICYLVL